MSESDIDPLDLLFKQIEDNKTFKERWDKATPEQREAILKLHKKMKLEMDRIMKNLLWFRHG